MREGRSIFMTVLMIVGFFVVLGVAVKLLGFAFVVAIKFLLPLAIIVWLVQFISRKLNQRN